MIQHLAWRARAGVFAFHCPNGGWRSCVEGAILKAIGTVAGVPTSSASSRAGFTRSNQSRTGRLTDVQRVVHERLREAGANVAIAHGLNQALRVLEGWELLKARSS